MTVQEMIEKVPELSVEERKKLMRVLIDSVVDEAKMNIANVSETYRQKESNKQEKIKKSYDD